MSATRWLVTVRFFKGGKDVWELTGATATEAGDLARERLWQGKDPIGMVLQIRPVEA